MIRIRWSLLPLALLLSLATTPTATAAPPDDGVWFAATTGQSYGEALSAIAGSTDPRAMSAKKLLGQWESKGARLRATTVGAASSAAAVANVSMGDANSWRVSGYPPGDKSYWISMVLIIDGVYCNSSGCTVTDHMQITSTVSPGVNTSRIITNILYSPNSGGLNTRRWYPYALCRGAVCSSQTPYNNNNMYIERYITHWNRSGGAPLTIALGVQVNTRYNTVSDGSKTADCYGASGNDPRCFYR